MSDYVQAIPLLAGQKAKVVLADKGYDANHIVEKVYSMGAEAVIPPPKKDAKNSTELRQISLQRAQCYRKDVWEDEAF